MDYPTTFSSELTSIGESGLSQTGKSTVAALSERGFEIVSGYRRADVAAVAAIASEESVREYCPKDVVSRLADESMAEAWLPSKGGHGMYLLRRISDHEIVGYGWVRHAGAEQLPIPEYKHTFAVRLSKTVTGQGLAKCFAGALIANAQAMYGTCNIGLETWGSNTGAIRTYLALGAVLVTTKDSMRPTRMPLPTETSGERRDVRLYMSFPATFTLQI